MPKIIELYAFIMEDTSPDDEGIPAANIAGVPMPLVGGDMARIESLKPYAYAVAKIIKKPVRIYKFTNREEIGVINP